MAPRPSKRKPERPDGEPDPGTAGQEQPMGIDAILDGLDDVVRDLEAGELPLERALERFEEGVRLARRGSKMLDGVEERVERLLADRDETVALRQGAADDDEDT